MTVEHESLAMLRDGAVLRGLHVWQGYPDDAPVVGTGDLEPDAFLDLAVQLGARVLYIRSEGADLVVGFAVHGVLHVLTSIESGDEQEDEQDDAGHAYDPTSFMLSWQDSAYDGLPPRLKAVADAVLADPRYDGEGRDTLVFGEHGAGLAPEEYETVRIATRMYFSGHTGREFDTEAAQVAALVLQHPDFDPLSTRETTTRIVESTIPVSDVRVLPRVVREVDRAAYQTGQVAAAEAALKREARALAVGLPRLLRDRIGFSSRNAQKDALLAPYLDEAQSQDRRRRLRWAVYEVLQADTAEREARYATAARAMIAASSSAAASRTLGISTAVIDRLLREYRHDVVLAADDPILTELAPQLAQ